MLQCAIPSPRMAETRECGVGLTWYSVCGPNANPEEV